MSTIVVSAVCVIALVAFIAALPLWVVQGRFFHLAEPLWAWWLLMLGVRLAIPVGNVK